MSTNTTSCSNALPRPSGRLQMNREVAEPPSGEALQPNMEPAVCVKRVGQGGLGSWLRPGLGYEKLAWPIQSPRVWPPGPSACQAITHCAVPAAAHMSGSAIECAVVEQGANSVCNCIQLGGPGIAQLPFRFGVLVTLHP